MKHALPLTLLLIVHVTICVIVLRRENMLEQFRQIDIQADPITAANLAQVFLQREPDNAKAHLVYARALMAQWLSKSQSVSESVSESEVLSAFTQAVKVGATDPASHRALADFHLARAHISKDYAPLNDYIAAMYGASRADPNNYFYYSIMYEELVALGQRMDFLRSGFSEETWLNAIGFALNNYLRLKDWYKEDYLNLLDALFTQRQKQVILATP